MAPAELFEGILQARSPDEIARRTADTLAANRLGSGEELRDAADAARQAYGEIMDELRRLSPETDVADLLLARRDLRSLKSFIKRRMEMDVSALPSAYGEEAWERLWEGLRTDLPPLFRAVVERSREAAAPKTFDAAYDSACLSVLCEAAGETGSGFITEYWRRFDTAKGVEWLWRARALGFDEEVRRWVVEGRQDRELFAALLRAEEEDWPRLLELGMEGLEVAGVASARRAGRIRAFVRAADEWLMGFARRAKYVPFGPERVFGCLVGLEAEAHNVGVAVAGRANEIDPARLRLELRACYV